jgi:hypothetical protein
VWHVLSVHQFTQIIQTCTNEKKCGRKIISSTIASKISLTKDVKDPYNKNYKALRKEIIEDTRRCIGRNNIVKMAILPKVMYRFNAVFTKIH